VPPPSDLVSEIIASCGNLTTLPRGLPSRKNVHPAVNKVVVMVMLQVDCAE
jgi:hypothetical protein